MKGALPSSTRSPSRPSMTTAYTIGRSAVADAGATASIVTSATPSHSPRRIGEATYVNTPRACGSSGKDWRC